MKATPLLALALLTGGCAGHALQHSYKEYSEVYAESVNSQLLLNLARLSQDEPPYFIQLGKITSSFKFTSSAEVNTSDSREAVKKNPTVGGKLGGGMENDPSFEYVPLNGAEFAKSINTVIPGELFYTLYDQGFHADDLARITLTSVEVDGTVYMNQPMSPTYPGFLAICASLRKAQLNQSLRYTERPARAGQTLSVATPPQSSAPLPPNDQPVTVKVKELKTTDVIAALEKGFTIELKDKETDYTLTAPPKTEKGLALVQGTGVNPVPVTDEIKTIEDFWAPSQRLKLRLRTFLAAMYAVTKEENYFEELLHLQGSETLPYKGAEAYNKKRDLSYQRVAGGGVSATLTNPEHPPLTFRPILTLTEFRTAPRGSYHELARSKLHGLDYVVADSTGPVNYLKFKSPTSNRKVFTLLSYLFTQISIDPKNLPVQQQLLQLR